MEQLIGAVRRYPCLWNSAAIEYRDQELKDAAWAEVLKETDLSSVKEVKLKWKKLRDSYRDALKRQSELVAREPGGGGGGGGGKRAYPWKYMGLMRFLQPHMNNRKKGSPPPAPALAPPPPAPAPRSSDSDSEGPAPKRAHRPPPAPASPDPLDAFFSGMCQSTKRLPFAAQLGIKRLVFAAVTQAEEALLAGQLPPAPYPAGPYPATPYPAGPYPAPWGRLSSSSSDAPTDDKGS